jgi:hypothetical protein
MAAAVLVAALLQFIAPEGGRIAPRWVVPLIELALLVVLMVGDPGRIDAPAVADPAGPPSRSSA